MDVAERRAAPSEKQRSEDLIKLFPGSGGIALDIGARDGHYSILLAERFERVIALDLEKPEVDHPRVQCVAGNAAHLEHEDDSIDFVLCAEVLEHIPTAILATVCREIERVSKDRFLIGVPYRQDIRVGRTTCSSCGKTNPPWGHINSFDEARLRTLFPGSTPTAVSMVGTTIEQTNALAAKLMDFAGNPYGSYEQFEPCIHCGAQLVAPSEGTLAQKVARKVAFWSWQATNLVARPRAKWIHILFSKKS